jgi:SAM-dependent methyltransferase
MNFLCSSCTSPVVFNKLETECSSCSWRPLNVSGKPSWLGLYPIAIGKSDPLDLLKSKVKKFPRTYTALTSLISPVYPFAGRKDLKLLLNEYSSGVMVNVGSGADRLHDNILNLDMQPFAQVDALVDAANLPIETGSVDFVVSISVLEHVREPNRVADEIVRVLKPGGRAYISSPFIAGFHSSPHDYQRYTLPGLVNLFGDVSVEKIIAVGPTSALIWIASEWLALVLSFGVARFQLFLAVTIGALLSPLKFLDSLLRHLPGSNSISVAFTLILKKVS